MVLSILRGSACLTATGDYPEVNSEQIKSHEYFTANVMYGNMVCIVFVPGSFIRLY